jgi:hypothetical protein
MPLNEAVDLSVAQLRLLSDAAARVEAARALLHAQGSYAGAAASVSREGGKVYDRLTKQLVKQTKGET